MEIDPERVKILLQEAIECGDYGCRRSFLDPEAGGNTELRNPLSADLDALDAPDVTRSYSPLPGAALDDRPTGDRLEHDGSIPIDAIIADRYELHREIGEGGMGTVYLAEQLRPVRRCVALKLIKRGMDSRNVLARFESERQALALMEHPNIAHVLDAGTTEDNRQFFVMELVNGIAITDYCDAHRLDLHARLGLFRQVCSAVQHAHQKGIIHRDLKPSNILVESHDNKPVPKVIDFGLAKAVSGLRLTEQSLFTAFGTVAGTPLYMAPEQASFNALDIDTRADIYSLGVILYELLTGSTPIARKLFCGAALDEMLRIIREVEPPTPSTRISMSETLLTLAANRQVEPARLSRLVRGDLDWIAMRALAKERERRYTSAVGLADDIERYLNHEPVSAGPPAAAYRLRKFVRRHRVQVGAAGLVLLALTLGVIGTTLGLIEAGRRRQQAEKISEILGSIFKDLDPGSAQKDGKPLSALLGERLDRATEEIEGETTGDPLAVARMQMTLGASQLGLGYPQKAIQLLTKALATFTAVLGLDNPNTLSTRDNLASAYAADGQYDRALKLREETLPLIRTKLGSDHPGTLASMNNLAISYRDAGQNDRALNLHEKTLMLRKAKLGPDHPDTLASMDNLAISYADIGQPERALKLREEVLALWKLKLGPDHPKTLASMINLTTNYRQAGQFAAALKLGEETLTLTKTRLGTDHPQTLASMNNLANSYSDLGRNDRSLKLREEALALTRAKLGTDHPQTIMIIDNLASAYASDGQEDRALMLREEILPLMKTRLGTQHPDTLTSMNNLAISYFGAGQTDRALKLFEENLSHQRRKIGPDHPDTLASMYNLAEGYAIAGQTDRALKLFEETLALWRARPGPVHPDTIGCLEGQARCLAKSGQLDRAAAILDEVVASRQKTQGNGHPETFRARISRAELDFARGRLDAAEAAGREILEECRTRVGTDDRARLCEALDRLIAAGEAAGTQAELAAWKAERAKLDAGGPQP